MYKLYLFLYCILGAAVSRSSVMSSFQSVHLFKGIEGVVNGMIMFYVLGEFSRFYEILSFICSFINKYYGLTQTSCSSAVNDYRKGLNLGQ